MAESERQVYPPYKTGKDGERLPDATFVVNGKPVEVYMARVAIRKPLERAESVERALQTGIRGRDLPPEPRGQIPRRGE